MFPLFLSFDSLNTFSFQLHSIFRKNVSTQFARYPTSSFYGFNAIKSRSDLTNFCFASCLCSFRHLLSRINSALIGLAIPESKVSSGFEEAINHRPICIVWVYYASNFIKTLHTWPFRNTLHDFFSFTFNYFKNVV